METIDYTFTNLLIYAALPFAVILLGLGPALLEIWREKRRR
jgi:hypothetical protein